MSLALWDDRGNRYGSAVRFQHEPSDEQARNERHKALAEAMHQGKKLKPKEIMFAVAFEDGFTIADLIARSRNRKLVECRHRAMVMIKQAYPQMSYPKIGSLFEREHTTVMHAIINYGKPRRYVATRKRQKPIDMDRAFKLRSEGLTYRAIGAILNVNHKTLGTRFNNAAQLGDAA